MSDRTTGPQGPSGSGGGSQPRRGFFTRNPLLLAILAVLALLAISNWLNTHNQEELTFSQFTEIVDRLPLKAADGSSPASQPSAAVEARFGKEPLVVTPQTIVGKLSPDPETRRRMRIKAAADSKGMIEFRVEKGSIKDEEIYKLLNLHSIQYRFDKQSDWGTYLIIALPILLFLAFFMMMFRSSRMTGENVLSFGRSRAKIVGEDKTGVTFDDVAGADEAKEELR